MAIPTKIALIPQPGEVGHHHCFIALARRLALHWPICFVGFADDRSTFERHGFEFVTLAEQAWPHGTVASERASQHHGLWRKLRGARHALRRFRSLIDALVASGDELAHFSLVICDSQAHLGALLALHAKRPCLLLHTTFSFWNEALPPPYSGEWPLSRSQWSWRLRLQHYRDPLQPTDPIGWMLESTLRRSVRLRDRDIVRRFERPAWLENVYDLGCHLPSMIACPKELDLPGPTPSNEFHVDALVDETRTAEAFDWTSVPLDRRLVYASMGSQPDAMINPPDFFLRLIKACERLPEVHLILAAGSDASCRLSQHAGATVMAWAPQRAVLERASLMISHAGLNGIKEGIHAGTALLAFPVGRDQPGNAVRIAHHGLGLRGDYRRASVDELASMIARTLREPTYRQNVAVMREHFERARARNRVVEIVGDAIRGRLPVAGPAGTTRPRAMVEPVA